MKNKIYPAYAIVTMDGHPLMDLNDNGTYLPFIMDSKSALEKIAKHWTIGTDEEYKIVKVKITYP